jgi:putative hemolysin secretion transport system ATP-binding protein
MRLFRKRFKCFRQVDTSDCGLACIRMVARHLGRPASMRELRSLCEVNKMGVTIRDICDGCRSLGLEPYALTIGPDMLPKIPAPAIIYWEQKHFVVLYEVDAKRRVCRIADPAEGKVTLPFDDFIKGWMGDSDKGVAIVVGTASDFKPVKRGRDHAFSGLARFVGRELGKHLGIFVRVILLSLFCMLSDIVLPLVFQRTIDEGIASRDIGLVWLLVLGQLGLFAGNFTSSTIVNYVLTKLGLKVDIEMVGTYLSKLIAQPLSFFDSRASSGLIQKISDQSRIKGFLLSLPQTVFFMLINLLVFSVMLIYYSPLIFVIFLALTLAGLLWTMLFLHRRRSIDYGFYSEAAENRNTVYELINGMPEIKTNNAQHIRFDKWRESQERINRLTMRSTVLGMTMGGGESVISRLKDLTIMGICATMVIHGELVELGGRYLSLVRNQLQLSI